MTDGNVRKEVREEQVGFWTDFENDPDNYSFAEDLPEENETYGDLIFKVERKKNKKASFFKKIRSKSEISNSVSLDICLNPGAQKVVKALLESQDDYHDAITAVTTIKKAFLKACHDAVGTIPVEGVTVAHDGTLCLAKLTKQGVSLHKLANIV